MLLRPGLEHTDPGWPDLNSKATGSRHEVGQGCLQVRMSLAWGIQPLPELPRQEVISLRDRRPKTKSGNKKKVAKTNAISDPANALKKEENPAAPTSVEEPGVPYLK